MCQPEVADHTGMAVTYDTSLTHQIRSAPGYAPARCECSLIAATPTAQPGAAPAGDSAVPHPPKTNVW
jgi:hypothetical protein